MQSQTQSSTKRFLPHCEKCGARFPEPKHKFDPHCPKCGAEFRLRCTICNKEFTPQNFRFTSDKHFCCDKHANQFRNQQRSQQLSEERAQRRAVPRQCARKGSIYAPGVRENQELLKDCPNIFVPEKYNRQKYCSPRCQDIAYWVDNYGVLTARVKEKSKLQYTQRKEQLAFANQHPPDWFKRPLDWRIIADPLLRNEGTASNKGIAQELLGGCLLNLTGYGATAEEIAKNRAFVKRVNEVRKWLRMQGQVRVAKPVSIH